MAMRLVLLVFLAVALTRCANVVPPTGGPRDTEAPILDNAEPPVGSLSFKEQFIRLKFNEYIRVQNASQIRISPALNKPPQFTERFNELTIDLGDSPLAPNTTYTINFGDALTDLNEGNKLQNFKYVFSTGLYIDSLRLSGMVIDAYKYTKRDQVLVGLFPADSIEGMKVGDKKPFYFVKTDKEGRFELENLRKGSYVLLAYDDKDNNLQYKAVEPVALFDSLVYPDTSSQSQMLLRLFENKAAILKITEKRSPEPGLVRLRFSTPVDSVHITPLSTQAEKGWTWWHSADSLLVYHQALTADSIVLACYYDDKIDTVVVTNRKPGERGLRNAGLRLFPGNQPSVIEPIILLASRPIESLDSTKIHWKADTTRLDFFDYKISITESMLRIQADLQPNTRYELFMDQGALKDWLGMPSDTFRFTFNSASDESFGALILEQIDSIPQAYTHVELLNDQYEVIQRLPIMRGKDLVFKQLRPISYRIRLLQDENGNGRWDGGDYETGRQPEVFWYYPETVAIRANWEVGISLGGSANK